MTIKQHPLKVAQRFFALSGYAILLCSTQLAADPGDLDTTFGTNGMVLTDLGSGNANPDDVFYDMAIQDDGKIVAVGKTKGQANVYDFALARYTSAGLLDTAFDGDGIVVSVDDHGNWNQLFGVVIQASGKIVAGGAAGGDFAMARYTAAGALDTTFGAAGTGYVYTSMSDGFDSGTTLALQSSGKIIQAGYADYSGPHNFAVARFSSDGLLDTSFGNAGVVLTDCGYSLADYPGLKGMIIQPSDDSIIVAGNSVNDVCIARYTANGALDNNFGTNGIALLNKAENFEIDAVALDANEKIVVAGRSSGDLFTVLRFGSDGVIDSSFGTSGVTSVDIGAGIDMAHDIAIQPDGKIILAGYSVASSGDGTPSAWTLMRFTSAGVLDAEFGTQGIKQLAATGGYSIWNLELLPSGKLLAGGIFGDSRDAAIASFETETPVAPTAENIYAATLVNTPVTVVFEGSDANRDALTYSVVTNPNSGTLSSVAGSTVTYTPSSNFSGVVTFTYKASDGISGDSAVKTATVNVFDAYRNPASLIGDDIDGEAAGDRSGYSVSLSSDGQTVAVGAPFNGDNGFDSGHVRVYTLVGSTWTPVGDDIDGEAAGGRSGYSVSLSSDGQTVAVGAPWNSSNTGQVRVYRLIDGNWSRVGEDIDGENVGDFSAWSVSLSSDGQTVAVGAPFNGDNGSGHVRVYTLVGSTWTPVGDDIDGEAADDESGHSVSLSSDGQTVAVGAPRNSSNTGQVRVYRLIDGNWSRVGEDIDGENVGDYSAWSVSLSSDGQTVAIGARYNDDNGATSGHVRVYTLVGGTWTPVGDDIDGEAAGDQSGYSVSLSSDGQTVAVGAPRNSSKTGQVRVYRLIDGNWSRVGEDIDGENVGDYSAWSVSLSSDGQTVAIGADYNSGNDIRSGHVRVYDLTNTAPVISGTPTTTVSVGSAYSFTPTTTDTDLANDNLTFDATVGPYAGPRWLSINDSTGELIGTPEASNVGTLSDVVITVSDGVLSRSLAAFNLVVRTPVAPTTPTIIATDYEDGAIRLTVSVADNGGANITNYKATCTDGLNAFTFNSSTTTITVRALTNGTTYTCTVTATNAAGISAASAPTAGITPEELATGLPIWLLYQATQ